MVKSSPHPTPLPWLGIAVIALHNLEEAITVRTWLLCHGGALQARIGIEPPSIPSLPFYAALVTVTVGPAIWVLLAHRARSNSLGEYSLAVLFGMFFANALVPHVAGAIALRGYVPGVLTAVTLVIPYFYWFTVHGLRSQRFTWPGLLLALAIAVVIYIVAGLALLVSGGLIHS